MFPEESASLSVSISERRSGGGGLLSGVARVAKAEASALSFSFQRSVDVGEGEGAGEGRGVELVAEDVFSSSFFSFQAANLVFSFFFWEGDFFFFLVSVIISIGMSTFRVRDLNPLKVSWHRETLEVHVAFSINSL